MVREDSMDKLAGSDFLHKLRQRRPNMMDTNRSQGIAAHFYAHRLGQVMYRVHQATSAAERLLIGSPAPLVPHLPCWAGAGPIGLMPCRHSLCRSVTACQCVQRQKVIGKCKSEQSSTRNSHTAHFASASACVHAYGAGWPSRCSCMACAA